MAIQKACATCLLLLLTAHTAPAAGGATLVGAGFTGRPLGLGSEVVMESSGLFEAIRDLTDPEEPRWIAWFDHRQAGGIWRDAVHDDGLVIAMYGTGSPGLGIVDVSDPGYPVQVAEMAGTYYTSARLAERILTVSTETYILVYDLDDPSAPAFGSLTVVGQYAGRRWLSAASGALFLVDHAATVRVMDASDPLHPVSLGTVALACDRIDAMVADAGHLYVMQATSGAVDELELVTYDVADPTAPVEADRRVLAVGPEATGMALVIDAGLLLAASSDDQVRAFSLADPARPDPIWSLDHRADRLTFTANLLLVSTSYTVYTYRRTDDLTQPSRVHERAFLPELDRLFGSGSMQVVQRSGSIAGLDVSNPTIPVLGPWLETGCTGLLIDGVGLGLMRESDHGYRVIDYRHDTPPVLAGAVIDPSLLAGAAAVGADVAAVGFGAEPNSLDLHIIDLSDPGSPVFRGRAGFGNPRVIDDRTMLTTDGGLVNLVDLADLDDPAPIGSVVLPVGADVRQCQIGSGHAFVVTTSGTEPTYLRVIEIYGPDGPRWIAGFAIAGSVRAMTLSGRFLLVATNHEVMVFDVADPGQPLLHGTVPHQPDGCEGIAVNGDAFTISGRLITYRVDGAGETDAPDAGVPAASRLEPAYPNPFNPSTTIAFTVGRHDEVTVSVHDVRGRKVVDLVSGTFEPGRHTVQWLGRDAAGQNVASGVYLVRLHGPGVESARTVTLVK